MNESENKYLEVLNAIKTTRRDIKKCMSPKFSCSSCKYKEDPFCVDNMFVDVLSIFDNVDSILKGND